MSNPLGGAANLPDPVAIDDTDFADGIDLGTVDDLDQWVQGLLSAEKSRRRPHKTPLDSRVPSDKVTMLRRELFTKGSSFAPVSRDEIVGIDNILSQIDEVIDWLIHYKDYTRFGSRPEPGIIFEGSPGTGKTYTSRYMATVSDALFVDVRDFPYSGKSLTAQDVKDLFHIARETHEKINKPIILFWDEFEGVAYERGKAGPDQRTVVSQITSELDGINGKPAGILLIGCTNYGDDIDAALRRPGRMGMQVEFNAPSRRGKAQLLDLYVSRIRTKGTIDVDTASYFFDDTDTAASVEEAVQQAWRFAVHRWVKEGRKRTGPWLTQSDLLEVFLKRLVGPPPAYSEVKDETLHRVAIHETGHAVTAVLLGVGLRLVTIRPGKEHLGKTMTYLEDPRTATIDELQSHLRVGVAGFVVEDITGITRGADSAGDTKAVTDIAIDLVDSQGVGKRVGLFNPHAARKRFYDLTPSISTRIVEDADLDVQSLIDQAEEDVRRLLTNFGADKIKKLAEKLVVAQTMTGKEFQKAVDDLG